MIKNEVGRKKNVGFPVSILGFPGKSIIALTVKDILDEQIAYKLA